MKTLRPRQLNKGDCIGLTAPASAMADPTKIEKAVRYFESIGFRVEVGKNVGKIHGYLAGTDSERVADLHAMFSDKRVRAIIALRGGYGTPRLLPLLDYRLITRNPKILCGFSDLTALQLALWKKCRLVTFHGPMAGVDFANEIDPYTEEMFWRSVSSTKKLDGVRLPDGSVLHIARKGSARGRLLGGNLSLIVALLGTPYQPEFKNSLLFLEEITEEPYRVDRMLMHLRNSAVLSKTNGVLFGQFTDCVSSDPSKPSLTTEEVLDDVVTRVKTPVLGGLPFGHIAKKMTLPIGLRAELDSTRHSLRFLEAAVQ